MPAVNLNDLKARFASGGLPSQSDFRDLIDTLAAASGNYQAQSVDTAALKDGAVTRAKLAAFAVPGITGATNSLVIATIPEITYTSPTVVGVSAAEMILSSSGLYINTSLALVMNIGGAVGAAGGLDTGAAGIRAAATVNQSGGNVTSVTVNTAGTGYTVTPVLTISDSGGGTGTGATATATVVSGVITGIAVTNPGSGYTTPVIYIPPPWLLASTWYFIWGISNGTTTTAIFSTSYTAPTLAGGLAGYTYKALLGAIYSKADQRLMRSCQYGTEVSIEETEIPDVANGTTIWGQADVSMAVPPNTRSMQGTVGIAVESSGPWAIALASDQDGLVGRTSYVSADTNGGAAFHGFLHAVPFSMMLMSASPQLIAFKTSVAATGQFRLTMSGYTLNGTHD